MFLDSRRGAVLLLGVSLFAGGCSGGSGVNIRADVTPDEAAAQPLPLARLSVSESGFQANGASLSRVAVASSEDGHVVVFESLASNLVEGDTNGFSDIFGRHRDDAETLRLSTDSAGNQANGPSFRAAISHEENAVAFESDATNLVADDTNGVRDVFVKDLETGASVRVSVATGGGQADGPSFHPAISHDGDFVVFESDATNLVPNDTNGVRDIFVHALETGETFRVSVASGGGQADGPSFHPVLAGESFVVFDSDATNLVADDTNGVTDVFRHDVVASTTIRVSLGEGGAEGDGPSFEPAVDESGEIVGFTSAATNLVPDDTNGVADVFVAHLDHGEMFRVSTDEEGLQADGPSTGVSLSGEGHYAAFESEATNLVADDENGVRDVFVKEVEDGEIVRISVNADGVQGNGASFAATISPDELNVTFTSLATNLVAGDTNGVADVFGAPNFFLIETGGGGGHSHRGGDL